MHSSVTCHLRARHELRYTYFEKYEGFAGVNNEIEKIVVKLYCSLIGHAQVEVPDVLYSSRDLIDLIVLPTSGKTARRSPS